MLRKLREKDLLKRQFEKFKGYRLVLCGHSLGAGVVSVLSVILQKEYPDLKCYAFSPPGCVFRLVGWWTLDPGYVLLIKGPICNIPLWSRFLQ